MTQSSNGKVVRAFHLFTLVDQSGNGRDITKGRQREQGAVKISLREARSEREELSRVQEVCQEKRFGSAE